MSARIVEIPAAVLASVQATPAPPRTLIAKRQYVPSFGALDDLEVSKVYVVVVPGKATDEFASRSGFLNTYAIDIGIAWKLASTTDPSDQADNAELDGAMQFVETLRNQFPAGYRASGSLLSRREIIAYYNDEKVRTGRVIQSLITLTFTELP